LEQSESLTHGLPQKKAPPLSCPGTQPVGHVSGVVKQRHPALQTPVTVPELPPLATPEPAMPLPIDTPLPVLPPDELAPAAPLAPPS
jgi:hypothetical protein